MGCQLPDERPFRMVVRRSAAHQGPHHVIAEHTRAPGYQTVPKFSRATQYYLKSNAALGRRWDGRPAKFK